MCTWFPFALPNGFLDRIGYRGGRDLVGLYWESAGDELAVYDDRSEWVGQHEHWEYLRLVRRLDVGYWLLHRMIDLGSTDTPAVHHLIVDRRRNQAWVAAARQAREIVARQRLDCSRSVN